MVRMVRFLKPSVTAADLRYLMSNLYVMDIDEDGKISMEDLLLELGLQDSPTKVLPLANPIIHTPHSCSNLLEAYTPWPPNP